MIRLLGILIGSATSIAIILLVTGMPEFHLENPQLDQKRFDEAVEKLMARKLDPEPMPASIPDASQASTNQETSVTETNRDAGPVNVPTQGVVETIGPTSTAQETPLSDNSPGAELPSPESHWYSFWNPFRSELAASGFVSQLEKVTGLDYRVVRVKTGVYEVAFAYLDDEERRFKLSQISAATGLDLPDS